jgi:hypothetical protein
MRTLREATEGTTATVILIRDKNSFLILLN